jgi:hypothetical protein
MVAGGAVEGRGGSGEITIEFLAAGGASFEGHEKRWQQVFGGGKKAGKLRVESQRGKRLNPENTEKRA